MHRRRSFAALALAAVAGAAALSACTGSSAPPPEKVATQRFLDAVEHGKAADAAATTTTPTTARADLQASLDGLGGGAKGKLEATRVHTKGANSIVDFTAAWTLRGADKSWKYTGHLTLTEQNKKWLVHWSPADLHPALAAGAHLVAERVQPERAALEDSAGKSLFANTAVVQVGIEPKLVKNLDALAKTLAAVPQLQSTAAEITRSVKAAANPTAFVPVITLRRDAYDQVRNRIHDLEGTVFQERTELLPPSAHFGQPLLGSVGEPTAEIIAKSKGRIVTGDRTGIGGLQQALNTTLAGSPGLTVVAADAQGTPLRTLATVSAPVAGKPVRLTLDRSTQQAAERAMSQMSQAAAIVAVQRSTGRVLADANTTATTYDYGLSGAFAPGSTFKIATWTGAFTARPSLTPATKVDCPATYTVDGRHFENENKFSYPPIPISSAFGYSCNTSAIKEAMSLPADTVVTAAKALGLGGTWTLPVSAFSGSMPAPVGQTEQGADAIGQGRVLASPLLIALMAGAASSGTPMLPSLTTDAPIHKGTPLPATITAKMNQLMKATVRLRNGTGHVLADLPQVIGKTGTAECGTATPPRSHAWFAGVQGDVAFSVFVYDGASQKVDPAEVAHRFLSRLPQR